jgi:hypothetical protein
VGHLKKPTPKLSLYMFILTIFLENEFYLYPHQNNCYLSLDMHMLDVMCKTSIVHMPKMFNTLFHICEGC